MKAAVLYGKKDLWIEERDEPAIRNPDEVLIKFNPLVSVPRIGCIIFRVARSGVSPSLLYWATNAQVSLWTKARR